MRLIEQLTLVAKIWSGSSDRQMTSVSNEIFRDANRLPRVLDGAADLTTRSFEKAMTWFSENWPAETPWPEGVERPKTPAVEAIHG